MLLPEHGAAAQALALLALPLLGSSLVLAGGRVTLVAIRWSAFQALALAGVGVTIVTLRPSWDQAAAAGLVLLVNALALPLLLYAAGAGVGRHGDLSAAAARYPARGSWPMGALAFGLIAVAFLLVRPLQLPGTAVAGPLVPTVVALWLVGAQIGLLGAGTTIRACGLLSIANGTLVLGLATGSGLCPVLGLGYGIDALALALVLGERALLGSGAVGVARSEPESFR